MVLQGLQELHEGVGGAEALQLRVGCNVRRNYADFSLPSSPPAKQRIHSARHRNVRIVPR
jgi:hypothetical protein